MPLLTLPWWNNVSVDLSGTAVLPIVSMLLGGMPFGGTADFADLGGTTFPSTLVERQLCRLRWVGGWDAPNRFLFH